MPVDRKIDEVFEEDLKVSGEYKTIAEEDEECVVTGLPHGDPTQQLEYVVFVPSIKLIDFLFQHMGECQF